MSDYEENEDQRSTVDDPRLRALRSWADSEKPAFNKSDNVYAFGMAALVVAGAMGGMFGAYMSNRSKGADTPSLGGEGEPPVPEAPEPTESDEEGAPTA